jgi:predicted acetyltransferase
MTANKYNGFRIETEKRLRNYHNTTETDLEHMYKRFGEEINSYLQRAKEYMRDYQIKSKADCAYYVQDESPKKFVTT